MCIACHFLYTLILGQHPSTSLGVADEDVCDVMSTADSVDPSPFSYNYPTFSVAAIWYGHSSGSFSQKQPKKETIAIMNPTKYIKINIY